MGDAGHGAAVHGRTRQLVEWFGSSFLGRWWLRLLEVELIDRSVALAAKGFVSLFPAVVAVASFAPERVRTGIASSLQRRLGLSGDSLEVARSLLTSQEQVRASTGALGLLLVLFFATSFTTALQRMYLRAWRRPPRQGLAKYATGLAWILGSIVLLATFGSLRRVFAGTPGTVLFGVLALVASTTLWWVTGFVMLQRQVRWRALLLPAAVTGLGGLLYASAAAVWVPRYLLANEAQFGFFGVAMTLVSWFTGLAFVVVIATTLGPVAAEGDNVLGRAIRGPAGTVLRPDAPHPAPPTATATATAPTLVDHGEKHLRSTI